MNNAALLEIDSSLISGPKSYDEMVWTYINDSEHVLESCVGEKEEKSSIDVHDSSLWGKKQVCFSVWKNEATKYSLNIKYSIKLN